jgi:hypothetical protein
MGNPLRRASIVDLYVEDSRRNMELARAEVIRTGRTVRIFGSKQDITADRQAMESQRRRAET